MWSIFTLPGRCAASYASQKPLVLARGRLPVLLGGPTGTGKSLLARHFVHARSGRKGRFVSVDLSTLPPDLVSAQLFGVARGAYTGASHDRKGAFEEADGGTLFLDEIGNLSETVQRMLLVVLQERRVTPIGSTREVAVDVKLIAASHEDLRTRVAAGTFRADLFMRLNPACTVKLPALVERDLDLTRLLGFCVDQAMVGPYLQELLENYRQRHGIRDESIAIPRRKNGGGGRILMNFQAMVSACGTETNRDDQGAESHWGEPRYRSILIGKWIGS